MTDYLHKTFPKTVGKTEFWKQIKRTVNGKEVTENDIKMIVDKIMENMDFNKDDHLLDLGCGNGALASNFFPYINSYTGVDFSEYLLKIATEYFQPHSNIGYLESDISNFVDTDIDIDKNIYSKILIYGVMAYLSRKELYGVLKKLSKDYVNVSKIYIGNIPNQKLSGEFFANRNIIDFDINDPKSQIGVWWLPEKLIEECKKLGFKVSFLVMPEKFYASKYRFDILMERI